MSENTTNRNMKFGPPVTPEDSKKAPNYTLRRKVAATIAAVGLLGAGAAAKTGFDTLNAPEKPVVTDTYVVQEGDTAWNIARQVETNQDGVRGNDEIRPLVDNISEQTKNDGAPRMMPGETIQLPANGDADPSTPGVQLEGPVEVAQFDTDPNQPGTQG